MVAGHVADEADVDLDGVEIGAAEFGDAVAGEEVVECGASADGEGNEAHANLVAIIVGVIRPRGPWTLGGGGAAMVAARLLLQQRAGRGGYSGKFARERDLLEWGLLRELGLQR